MPVVRGDFSKQLVPGAKKAFADEYEELPAFYPTIFFVDTSDKATEEYLVSTGLATAVVKAEGAKVTLDVPKHRGSVTVTHSTYGLGYEVSQEVVEDDLYGVVSKPSSRFLARSLRDAEEVLAWGVINNAASTQKAYDGVSLLNTAHPTIGDTIANRPAADIDLSVTALQASLERWMKLRTDRGLRMRKRPTHLVVPVENFWLANEILRSEFKPFTANNEVNILRQMGLTPFECPYITDTDMWVTVEARDEMGAIFLWRRRPAFDDDFMKAEQVALFMITARFSVVTPDWRWIDGSIGA